MSLSLVAALSALGTLCAAEQQALYQAADEIEAKYVFEDKAHFIADSVRADVALAREAKKCEDKDAFVARVSEYLREISDDPHFKVRTAKEVKADTTEKDRLAAAPTKNFGLPHVQILKGNTGYIRIDHFYGLDLAQKRYQAAMMMVADTKGLIIDLRGNEGGAWDTAWPLQWTFMDPGMDSPLAIATQSGPRLLREPDVKWDHYGLKRPVMILIDEHTSAQAEEVAHTLQSVGRAWVIGETSNGKARMNSHPIQLGKNYILYVPEKRPVSTKTGGNWESDGVKPDVETLPNEALSKALSLMTDKKKKKKPESQA